MPSDAKVITLSSDSSSSSSSSSEDHPIAGPSKTAVPARARKRRAPAHTPSATTAGAGAAAARAARQPSAELDVPHALDDASRTQLHVAIATAPEARVREAFAALVDSIPAVTERVFGMLLAAPAPAPAPASADVVIEPDAVRAKGRTPRTPKVKRTLARPVVVPVPQWEACANCGKQYDAGAKRQGAECRYHPGGLKVSYGALEAWDEDVQGEMDTRAIRREFPENFTWTCCRRDGTNAGCMHGEHESEEGQSQRKRKKGTI